MYSHVFISLPNEGDTDSQRGEVTVIKLGGGELGFEPEILGFQS